MNKSNSIVNRKVKTSPPDATAKPAARITKKKNQQKTSPESNPGTSGGIPVTYLPTLSKSESDSNRVNKIARKIAKRIKKVNQFAAEVDLQCELNTASETRHPVRLSDDGKEVIVASYIDNPDAGNWDDFTLPIDGYKTHLMDALEERARNMGERYIGLADRIAEMKPNGTCPKPTLEKVLDNQANKCSGEYLCPMFVAVVGSRIVFRTPYKKAAETFVRAAGVGQVLKVIPVAVKCEQPPITAGSGYSIGVRNSDGHIVEVVETGLKFKKAGKRLKEYQLVILAPGSSVTRPVL